MGLFTFIENYSSKINSFVLAPLLIAVSDGLLANKWLSNNLIILLIAVFIIIENVLSHSQGIALVIITITLIVYSRWSKKNRIVPGKR